MNFQPLRESYCDKDLQQLKSKISSDKLTELESYMNNKWVYECDCIHISKEYPCPHRYTEVLKQLIIKEIVENK